MTEVKLDMKQLEKDYLEAQQDPILKNFLEKIKINKEIAKKYTSLLQESCVEYNHCLNCKGLADCQNNLRGYAYLPKKEKEDLVFSYKPCHYKKKQDTKFNYLKNVTYYNIPEALKEANFDEIDNRIASRKEAIKWIYQFKKDYPNVNKGLFLHGNFGCGKSYLVSALFNELAKQNIKSVIVFWPEFLRNLKSSFDTDFEEKIEKVKRTPLLLIDDLGAETVTTWGRDEILCTILQYRMEMSLPTFITSNLTITELEQHLSTTKDSVEAVKARRIIERIKQLTFDLEMISKNMRN